MSGISLGVRAKQLVASLITFFEKERDNGGPFIPLTAVRERVSVALGLSIGTVKSISQTIAKNEPFTSKKRIHTKPVIDVDEFTKSGIRNVIYRLYDNHEHISVHTLWQNLKHDELFNGSKRSLNTILHNIGFKWQKDNPRRGLMELPNIVDRRIRFLKTYKRIKEENLYQFVFVDETWIFQNGAMSRSWQDSDLRTVKSTRIDGKRYIVLHAGNVNGFIDGAELIFSSSTNDPDYHGEMNEQNFLYWFENQLLKNLEAPSAIVLDNASYHSTVLNKIPNSSWKKSDIAEWLTKQTISFDGNALKAELLKLVMMYKPPKIFKADLLTEQYGHKVLNCLRITAYLIQLKMYGVVVTATTTDTVEEMGGLLKTLQMWKETLEKIIPEIWAHLKEHAEKIIKDWWKREIKFDQEDNAPLIINIGDSDDSDSDFQSN